MEVMKCDVIPDIFFDTQCAYYIVGSDVVLYVR